MLSRDMQLTQHTDFSLRVLMYLGATQNQKVTIDELTMHLGILRNHVTKIVNRLANLGYIHTMRGKGGGMRLAHSPADISIGAVVRQTEPGTALVNCQSPPCSISGVCKLVYTLAEAKAAFFKVLDDVTLADLVENEDELRAKFALGKKAQEKIRILNHGGT